MLTRFLDRGLSDADRVLFESLLDTSDDVLWSWLMGRQAPPQEAMDGLVQRIRSTPGKQ